MKKLPLITSVIIFFSTLGIYIASPITAHTDSLWSLFFTTSFIKTGNFNLDEYSFASPTDTRLEMVNGHIYSVSPIGIYIMAAPIVYVIDQFPFLYGTNLSTFLASHPPGPDVWGVEKNVASVIVALNAVLIFALAMEYLNIVKSVILTVIFAFATSAWSTASRGLWQHGPSMLCLTLALYLTVIARRKPAISIFIAIPLAFSYFVRPTNGISIVVFTIFVFLVHRRYFVYYLICFLLCISPFFIYNYSIYSHFLSNYYGAKPLRMPDASSLLGIFLSPSRGLLIFSPIFLLSFYGAYLRLFPPSKQLIQEIEIYLVVIILLHWLTFSAFPYWHAGWSIGPRYFSDMIPYLTFLIIPVLELLPLSFRNSIKPNSWKFIFGVLAAFSIFVQYRCSTNIGPSDWNGKPVDVDLNISRVWYWGDIQFLRNMCFDLNDQNFEAPKCWLNTLKTIYRRFQAEIYIISGLTQENEFVSRKYMRVLNSPVLDGYSIQQIT